MTNNLVPTPGPVEPEILDNLYDRLGVPQNASDVAIKKAYRALSAFYHPDVKGTGNNKMFAAIKEAYDILSDKEKRAMYDETGCVEEPRIDDRIELEARQQCAMILSNIIAQESNPDQSPILQKLIMVFKLQERGLAEQRHELKDRERRVSSLRRRLKRKKGGKKGRSSILLLMLDHHLKEIAAKREELDKAAKVIARVQEIFDEYDYEVDLSPMGSFEQFREAMTGPNAPKFTHSSSSKPYRTTGDF